MSGPGSPLSVEVFGQFDPKLVKMCRAGEDQVWKPFSGTLKNGGAYGTRTRNLRRDRAAL